MTLDAILNARSGGNCEVCGGNTDLKTYEVLPATGAVEDYSVLLCNTCRTQVDKKAELDPAHWSCLTTSMWSEVPGVQVISWRMLNRLREQSWAAEQLDMMYLDEERLAWAKASGDHENDATVDLHRDANGAVLQNGDTVVLTKSLDVKGTSLNARLGTVVKNIRLVPDNTEQIEGKIEGQTIVILTKYLRKQA
ncbi:alkylphosphonate utilization protein [Chitinophaga sp. CB10]|uniref:PhnA domain-containing protein n=1 Tax=Chitinophaga sp. CB10 TaxID=1891659 RepID=UPI0025C32E31|nr:alkylphosphonate utilization protein [Chitinophaga sp. CB10]